MQAKRDSSAGRFKHGAVIEEKAERLTGSQLTTLVCGLARPEAGRETRPAMRERLIRRLSTDSSASVRAFARDNNVGLETLAVAAWAQLAGCYGAEGAIPITVRNESGERAIECPVAAESTVEECVRACQRLLREEKREQTEAAPSSARNSLIGLPVLLALFRHELPRRDIRENYPLIIELAGDFQICLAISFDPARFDAAFVDVLLGCLSHLLEQMPGHAANAISTLELVPQEIRARFQLACKETLRVDNPVGLHHLFEEECRQAPETTAAVFEGRQISYRELNERANQLAHYLRRLGCGPETVVALHFGRSIELLVAIMGVLKSGAAFLPLDASLPLGRVQTVIEDSQTPIVIAARHLASRLAGVHARVFCLEQDTSLAGESREDPRPRAVARNLAYVTYTSGSTGKPKGVMIEHRNLAAFGIALEQMLGKTRGVWLAAASISFDIAVAELVWTLSRGCTVVLHAGDDGIPIVAGPDSVPEQIVRYGVTHLQGTPTLVRMLANEPSATEAFRTVRICFMGGEPFPPSLAARLLDLIPGDVINGYGPTETTICSTSHVIRRTGAAIPIGRPLANSSVYVLDRWGRILPPLAAGELFIGGASVARGYLHRPDLTAERFLPNRHDDRAGSRVYRTGDLVRFNLDGELEFLDRMDFQVKIRGHRIELGEIENVMESHAAVRQAAVVVRTEPAGGQMLVGYYTGAEGQKNGSSDLRSHLERALPRYMVPPALIELTTFPLTPTGKVDRSALAQTHVEALRRQQPRQGVETLQEPELLPEQRALETELCSWCGALLARDHVHPTEDFFEMGGHSLIAAQLVQRIKERHGVQMKLSTLIRARTMRAIAEQISKLKTEQEQPAWSPVVPIQTGGAKPPLFFVAGLGGNVVNFEFVSRSLSDRPVYGIEAHGLNKNAEVLTTVEDMARSYLEELLRVQSTGPFHLAGYSFGGVLAFEMAQQLQAAGHEVGLLALIDTSEWQYRQDVMRSLSFLKRFDLLYGATLRQVVKGPQRLKTLQARLRATFENYLLGWHAARGRHATPAVTSPEHRNYYALTHYTAQPYAGDIDLFRCMDNAPLRGTSPCLGWDRLAPHVFVSEIPGEHETLLNEPFAAVFARKLATSLDRIESSRGVGAAQNAGLAGVGAE